MPLLPSNPTKELVALYSHAQHAEFNIGEFIRRHPDLRARLGHLDLCRDDAELALQLAPTIGRYKKQTTDEQRAAKRERAEHAVRELIAAARHTADRVMLDVDVLLGDVLADVTRKYVCFELHDTCVDIHRHVLVRAKAHLRSFDDLAAHLDPAGLHLRWRAGRGGLNFRAQQRERRASVLLVDLRPPHNVPYRPPTRLGEILADMALH